MWITKNRSSICFFRWRNNFFISWFLCLRFRCPGLNWRWLFLRLWKLIIQIFYKFFLGCISFIGVSFSVIDIFVGFNVGLNVWFTFRLWRLGFRRLVNNNEWSKISNELILFRFAKSLENFVNSFCDETLVLNWIFSLMLASIILSLSSFSRFLSYFICSNHFQRIPNEHYKLILWCRSVIGWGSRNRYLIGWERHLASISLKTLLSQTFWLRKKLELDFCICMYVNIFSRLIWATGKDSFGTSIHSSINIWNPDKFWWFLTIWSKGYEPRSPYYRP